MWSPIHRDEAANGILYELWVWQTPGQAAPFSGWYIRRTTRAASFLISGVNENVDYASFATHGGDSADAWAGRSGLTYGNETIPDAYTGNASLLAQAGSGSTSRPSTNAGDLVEDIAVNSGRYTEDDFD